MKNKNMCTLKELNLQAAMLKGKGDLEGVIRLAEANGLTVRTAERYLMGEEPTLTTQKELAIGRLLLDSVDLDLRQSVALSAIRDRYLDVLDICSDYKARHRMNCQMRLQQCVA